MSTQTSALSQYKARCKKLESERDIIWSQMRRAQQEASDLKFQNSRLNEKLRMLEKFICDLKYLKEQHDKDDAEFPRKHTMDKLEKLPPIKEGVANG